MPTMWIERDISQFLAQNSDFVEILTGPRQCGKSSLLLKLDPEFLELSLDDLSIREALARDPLTFLSQFDGKKLLIDEAQLVPELFSAIKRKVDLMKRAGVSRETYFRLTGSNQILMDKNVKESLAGRASYFELNTFSIAEIINSLSFSTADILFRGGWPELYTVPNLSIKHYLDDYIRTYVEKDIVLAAGIQKQNQFMKFIKLLAGRTGQVLNSSELARDVGVSVEAIKDWVSILERMKVIVLINPFYTNLTSRLIKSPKIYFLDTGLAVRLQGHSELTPLLTSPALGSLFETLVCGEIIKTLNNFRQDWKIFHWRSRDGEEIDFYIQFPSGKSLFLEAKTARQDLSSHEKFTEVKKVFKDKVPPRYLVHMEGETILGNLIPIKKLRDFLLS